MNDNFLTNEFELYYLTGNFEQDKVVLNALGKRGFGVVAVLEDTLILQKSSWSPNPYVFNFLGGNSKDFFEKDSHS